EVEWKLQPGRAKDERNRVAAPNREHARKRLHRSKEPAPNPGRNSLGNDIEPGDSPRAVSQPENRVNKEDKEKGNLRPGQAISNYDDRQEQKTYAANRADFQEKRTMVCSAVDIMRRKDCREGESQGLDKPCKPDLPVGGAQLG